MTIKQIKKAVLSLYNKKRSRDGQSPTTELSRQVQSLIESIYANQSVDKQAQPSAIKPDKSVVAPEYDLLTEGYDPARLKNRKWK
jgi:hypothetical protein